MENFKERREKILGVFTQAKSDLEQLNRDIDETIKNNNAQIIALQTANSNLQQLKAGNESSIKGFAKFIK